MPKPAEDEDGNVMAGDRRLSRPDSSLPDWEVPDSSYRPIPIVWFTGALLAQLVSLTAISILLSSKHGLFTLAGAVLMTGLVANWTWRRGMQTASRGWQVATITMLAAQLLLVIVAVSDRL